MKIRAIYAIIIGFALITPAVAGSSGINDNSARHLFKTYRLFVSEFCEFNTSLSADWTQIASDQVKIFNVKRPSLKDLKEHAV